MKKYTREHTSEIKGSRIHFQMKFRTFFNPRTAVQALFMKKTVLSGQKQLWAFYKN